MSWIVPVLVAVLFAGFADIFRKLASDARDPYFINLVYHFSGLVVAFVLFLMNKKYVIDGREIAFATVSGALISVATVYSIKALSIGPSVSIVMPAFRAGATILTVILGLIILREKMSVYTVFGLIFALTGIYLLFMEK